MFLYSDRDRDTFESIGVWAVFPLPMPCWRTITQVLLLGRKASPWGGRFWLRAFISPQPRLPALCHNPTGAPCAATRSLHALIQYLWKEHASPRSCRSDRLPAVLCLQEKQGLRHTQVQNHLAPGSTAPSPLWGTGTPFGLHT